mgnify:CR=1 FL=1
MAASIFLDGRETSGTVPDEGPFPAGEKLPVGGGGFAEEAAAAGAAEEEEEADALACAAGAFREVAVVADGDGFPPDILEKNFENEENIDFFGFTPPLAAVSALSFKILA